MSIIGVFFELLLLVVIMLIQFMYNRTVWTAIAILALSSWY
ncbi:hypothetical protein [Mycobacterium uberis]|nr:hypothetical protein [Mycobacterium uberis]